MRAFYKIPVAALGAEDAAEAGSPFPDAVVCDVGYTWAYLLAARDHDPAIEAAGGVRLGARLSELKASDRARFEAEPGIPKTIFAGDDLADYQ